MLLDSSNSYDKGIAAHGSVFDSELSERNVTQLRTGSGTPMATMVSTYC